MELDGKRILVVGGAGFVGSHLVDELLKTGVKEVVVYDNLFRGSLENLESALRDPRVSVYPHGGDILHEDILNKAMEGMDGVFHLAALWLLQCHEYPRSAFEVNVRGTFNVIEACIRNKVRKLVYSSSASVYGNAVELPMTEDHPYENNTFYGATKIAGEHMLKSLGHRYGLEWNALRYMNVYGPRQDYLGAYIAVMMKILDNVDRGVQPVVYGDGTQQYDFIHVLDVARANIRAMESDTKAGCYNVGRGAGTSIKELSELLLELTGSGLGIRYEPQGQTFVTNRIGSTSRAEAEIGFRWSIGLREGMESLIAWRRSHRAMVEARRLKAEKR